MSRQLLALAITDRRQELGLTVVEAAKRAGVARSTWSDLELLKRERITASVARRVDDVLGWAPGTTLQAFQVSEQSDSNYAFRSVVGLSPDAQFGPADGRARLERVIRQLSDADAALLAEIGERMVALEQLHGSHAQLVDAIARAQRAVRRDESA